MSQSNKRPYATQQRPAARPAQPVRRPAAQTRRRPAPRKSVRPALNGWLRSDLARILIGGTLAVVLTWFLQTRWMAGFTLSDKSQESAAASIITEIHSSGPLRINEIMTSNRDTISEEDGSSPDWIEIANVSDLAVNLEGYALAKVTDAAQTFAFPDMVLEPGECVVVLADSRLRTENPEALHAPFRMSSAGDTLMLFNAGGTAVDTVNIPALDSDVSYVRKDVSHWEMSSMPTPGMPNTEEGYRALTEPSGDSPVIVAEIMAVNTSTFADENGEYYDYIELYNRSSAAVDLTGWYLSDDVYSPRRWSLPQVTLEAGERLVVFASKLNRKDDVTHLHTNFALGSEGEMVVLSNPQGRVMDKVEYDILKANVAWMLGADGIWSLSDAATPGN